MAASLADVVTRLTGPITRMSSRKESAVSVIGGSGLITTHTT